MGLPARHAVGYLRNGKLITLSLAISLKGEGKVVTP